MQFGDERLPARYWSKVSVDDESGCWLWIGCITTRGYPQIRWRVDGRHKTVDAARLARGIAAGLPGPTEAEALLRGQGCPSHCVNPVHATEGTLVDTGSSKQSHCYRGHPLEGDNLEPNSNGGRRCVACRRISQRESRRRLYPERKAKGLCVYCGKTALRGQTACRYHRDYHRGWQRRRAKA